MSLEQESVFINLKKRLNKRHAAGVFVEQENGYETEEVLNEF
jgi:hypothetical protein